MLKPDLTAPGRLVVSADSGTGNGSRALTGTSQAAPHVAGMAALVRQAHPDWTPQEVKAALMNTAGTDLVGSAESTAALAHPAQEGTRFTVHRNENYGPRG